MKIRTAVFTVYVAASAIGFAVLMRTMLAEVRPRYIRSLQHNLADAAQLLATALEDRREPTAALRQAAQSGLRVRLVAPDGIVSFDTADRARPEAGEFAMLSSEKGLMRRLGSQLIDGKSNGSETEIRASAPLRLAEARAGTLVLSRSIRSVNAVVWAEREKLAGIALAVAAVMVIAGWWIAARLTRSLERLTLYAQGVRDGRNVTPPRSRATEIAALATAFEEMRAALEGRQHIERYTQALAHEVKAPLAAIRGAAELLSEDMSEEQREKFLGNIRGEAARIQQLVERLLELSSLEARKVLCQTEPIDLAELMNEAANVMRPAYDGASVTLKIRDSAAMLWGERVLLREALVNLLQNALDFSPPGGVVTFSGALASDRVIMEVEDQGPGVPDYALARVFERFYSLPRPGTTRKSTGLGLALTREIAHLHGGEAALANRAEGGVRATFWLPRGRSG